MVLFKLSSRDAMVYSFVSELLFMTKFPVLVEAGLVIISSVGYLTHRGFIKRLFILKIKV